MVVELLEYVGESLQASNPYIEAYAVNAVRLKNGKVAKLSGKTDFEYVGISDLNGAGFYIRLNGKPRYSPRKARTSCGTMYDMNVPIRLVFYSTNTEFDGSRIENKLVTDLLSLNFSSYTGNAGNPKFILTQSSSESISIFEEETGIKFTSGDRPVIVSIDATLSFILAENDCNNLCNVYEILCGTTSPPVPPSPSAPMETFCEAVQRCLGTLPPGPPGPQGEQGEIGPQGPQGEPGQDGADGSDGVNGTNGTNGIDGQDGADGAQGIQGPAGADGEQGEQGVQGIQGIQGLQGNDGADGIDGMVAMGWYNAQDYGCVGDGIYLYDGAITSGTAILTSATASFTLSDVGKVIKVNGAGAASADFTRTILSFQSATQVTLSANALTTVTAAFVAYGTDDTVALQALINSLFSSSQKGGTIFFPDGIYIINGALQTSVSGQNPNCQIYLPVLDNTVTDLPSISFVGGTSPFPANSRKVGTVVLDGGAIFHSTLTSVSGSLPAMFGGCNTTVAINNATFIRATFENIRLRVCSHALVAGPVLTGINAARWQALACREVVVDADCVSHASLTVMPTNEAIGILYPQINTSNNLSSWNVYVSYFKYGIVPGELMTLLSAIVVTSNYPYVFTKGNYPALCGHLRITHCPNSVLVASSGLFSTYDGPSVFDIQQLDVEVETAGGNWQDGVTGLIDIDNNGLGRITYSYVDSSPHTQMPFPKSGGTGVHTNLIGTLGGDLLTGLIFDEINKRLGIGGPPVLYPLEVYSSENTAARIQIENTSSGTLAQAQLTAKNNSGQVISIAVKSSGFTSTGPSGLIRPNQTTIISNATDSFILGSTTSAPLIFIYGGSANGNESGRIDNTGLSFGQLLKTLTFSAANKMAAQTTLVAGTKAITITGLTTSHRALLTFVSIGGTVTTTWQYKAVCTANTLTITAITTAGATNTSDTSVLNYAIFLNN